VDALFAPLATSSTGGGAALITGKRIGSLGDTARVAVRAVYPSNDGPQALQPVQTDQTDRQEATVRVHAVGKSVPGLINDQTERSGDIGIRKTGDRSRDDKIRARGSYDSS